MFDIAAKLENACVNRRVYLYGAGMYGRILCSFMKEKKIGKIENFIVSEQETQRVVWGKNVISLHEYSNQRAFEGKQTGDDLIIIAVSEQYCAEIIKELESKKIYNYINLSMDEWKIIEQNTSFVDVIPKKNIAVLMYHRIIDSDYHFWKLNVSPKIFEQQIKYISKNYDVLKLGDEWQDIVKENQKYVAITFDDGYVDNYRFALPVLEKYHVPATIFVSTDLIDTDEMYWWDELEKIFVLDKYIGEFILDGVTYKAMDLKSRENICLTIRNKIKNMTPLKRKECMRELRLTLGVKQAKTSELRCINTQELRRMAESPYVTIGGHTKSHLSMGSFHSNDLLRLEIEESLTILEKKIGRRPDVFAYPFGGADDRCDMADQILLECGIKKSLLVRAGNINVNDKMYNLPRHMIFEDDDIEKKLNRIWGIYG